MLNMRKEKPSDTPLSFKEPICVLVDPLQRFLLVESADGLVLLFAAATALILAIADDIGAILVIAIGYSGALNYHALGMSLVGVVLFVTLLKLGVRNNLVYLLMGN